MPFFGSKGTKRLHVGVDGRNRIVDRFAGNVRLMAHQATPIELATAQSMSRITSGKHGEFCSFAVSHVQRKSTAIKIKTSVKIKYW